ncbi:MAG TPA: hypothetical protein VGD98_11305 [Ktedonobacteraceae bacterium]
MKHAMNDYTPDHRWVFVQPSVTLAFQRVQQIWRLFCLVVSTGPLYARVALTASLRTALTSSSQSADIAVQGQTNEIAPAEGQSKEVSAAEITQLTSSLKQIFQQNLGSYLHPSLFMLQTAPFPIVFDQNNAPSSFVDHNQLSMIGVDISQASSHLKLAQGHFPSSDFHNNTLEIALRADIASPFHWHVGTVIPLGLVYLNLITHQIEKAGQRTLAHRAGKPDKI